MRSGGKVSARTWSASQDPGRWQTRASAATSWASLVVDEGARGVAVEAEGDGGEAQGVGEGFGEVPDGAEAALVVVTRFAGLPDVGEGVGEVAHGAGVGVGFWGSRACWSSFVSVVSDVSASIT